MPQITNLPNDILYYIFGYLATSRHYTLDLRSDNSPSPCLEFFNLSYVCKQFRAIAVKIHHCQMVARKDAPMAQPFEEQLRIFRHDEAEELYMSTLARGYSLACMYRCTCDNAQPSRSLFRKISDSSGNEKGQQTLVSHSAPKHINSSMSPAEIQVFSQAIEGFRRAQDVYENIPSIQNYVVRRGGTWYSFMEAPDRESLLSHPKPLPRSVEELVPVWIRQLRSFWREDLLNPIGDW